MKTLPTTQLPMLFISMALLSCQKAPDPTLTGSWILIKTEHWSNNQLIGLSDAEFGACIYTFTADQLIISNDGVDAASAYQVINNQILQPNSFTFTIDLLTQSALNLSKTFEAVTMRYFFTKKP